MTDDERSKALAELLATPLDRYEPPEAPEHPPPPGRFRWSVLVAFVIGAAVVLAGYVIATRNPDEEPTIATTIAPTTTVAAPVGDTFPSGFTAVDESHAVRVVRVAPSGGDLAVTMTSVVARGLDAAASTPFTGGRWAAVLRDGSTVAARGQLADPATPGVVTALFDPAEVSAENLASLRLSERWFHESVQVVQELEVSGDLPWALPERELLDLGSGTQLIVDSMQLTETGGIVEWSLVGGTALGIVSVEIALEEGFFDGQPRMMVPIARVDRFFFDPATAVPNGTIELSGPTAADGEGIAQGQAFWSVRLTVTAPADALIPVSGS